MLDFELSNWVDILIKISFFWFNSIFQFQHVAYFNYLKQNVIDFDLLVDSLYYKVSGMMWPKLVFSLMCDSNNYDLTVWSLLLLLGCKIDSRQWWSVVCLRRLSISSKTTTKKSILFFINSKLRYCCYSLVIHMFNHVFRQVQVVVNQLDRLLRRKSVRKNVLWSIHQVELFHFMVFQCLVKKQIFFFSIFKLMIFSCSNVFRLWRSNSFIFYFSTILYEIFF